MKLLIKRKKTNLLLESDWMTQLGMKLETEKTNPKILNIREDTDITELKRNFKKLFHMNETVKGIEVDIQLKPDVKLLQQEGCPIPIHLKLAVDKVVQKLKRNSHNSKSNKHQRKLPRQPSSNNCEERQNGQIGSRFTQKEQNNREKKCTNIEHGRADITEKLQVEQPTKSGYQSLI